MRSLDDGSHGGSGNGRARAGWSGERAGAQTGRHDRDPRARRSISTASSRSIRRPGSATSPTRTTRPSSSSTPRPTSIVDRIDGFVGMTRSGEHVRAERHRCRQRRDLGERRRQHDHRDRQPGRASSKSTISTGGKARANAHGVRSERQGRDRRQFQRRAALSQSDLGGAGNRIVAKIPIPQSARISSARPITRRAARSSR